MNLTNFIFILLSITYLTMACSKDNSDLTNKSIEEVAQMIQDEVGNAAADSADRCDILPIGVKPAGGPWGYLVFSTEISDRDKLERLVERYNELDAQRNDENGGFSTADMASKPALMLRDGACFGDGPYAWNSGDILDINGIE
jgi:hypothetical protein